MSEIRSTIYGVGFLTHGVASSIHDRIVEIIKQCEAGELSPKASNIGLFDHLL